MIVVPASRKMPSAVGQSGADEASDETLEAMARSGKSNPVRDCMGWRYTHCEKKCLP